jgi:hypothetical protein
MKIAIIVSGRDEVLAKQTIQSLRGGFHGHENVHVIISGSELASAKNAAVAELEDSEALWFITAGDAVVTTMHLDIIAKKLVGKEFFCKRMSHDRYAAPLVSRSSFISAGGFREFFVGAGYEDHDLCTKLVEMGYSPINYQVTCQTSTFMFEENDARASDSSFELRHDIKQAGYMKDEPSLLAMQESAPSESNDEGQETAADGETARNIGQRQRPHVDVLELAVADVGQAEPVGDPGVPGPRGSISELGPEDEDMVSEVERIDPTINQADSDTPLVEPASQTRFPVTEENENSEETKPSAEGEPPLPGLRKRKRRKRKRKSGK